MSAGQLPGCQFATGPPLRARLPCLQARRRPVEDDDEQASSSGGRAGGFSFEVTISGQQHVFECFMAWQ